jgi:xanthine dehydrogenase YagT iron-sulfur-binding subunit
VHASGQHARSRGSTDYKWTGFCIGFGSSACKECAVETPVAARSITLRVNGAEHALAVDARMSLLDALRERLRLTGTKKGCNQGACGACTVLNGDQRILSCLALAVQFDGAEITTIEGLANGELHPLQAAFLEYDGLQCGYCTPGQICSGIGMLAEYRAGLPSAVSARMTGPVGDLTDEEIAERMSGNLCRCGAYVGIRAAIRSAADRVRP